MRASKQRRADCIIGAMTADLRLNFAEQTSDAPTTPSVVQQPAASAPPGDLTVEPIVSFPPPVELRSER